MEFVSEPSQAAPPLGATAAAGAPARAPAVPPPAPLFMEFVSEPSLAAPPLGATAAAGASARAPAVPPPAPLFMEFVSEPSHGARARGQSRGADQGGGWSEDSRCLGTDPRRSTTGATVQGVCAGTFAGRSVLRGTGRARRLATHPRRSATGATVQGVRVGNLACRPTRPHRAATRASAGGLGCMASCPSFARRAFRSCDVISRLIIRARLIAAFHGASAAASARARASSAFRPRSTGGGAAANRPRASRPTLQGACLTRACPRSAAFASNATCDGCFGHASSGGPCSSRAAISGRRCACNRVAFASNRDRTSSVRRYRCSARRGAPDAPYNPCVVCALATLANPSGVRGPVLFPPCDRHRPFAIAPRVKREGGARPTAGRLARQAQPVRRAFAPRAANTRACHTRACHRA